MVEVRFTIFEEHNHRVREGSIVELQSSPIGLGNSFLFYPGKGDNLKYIKKEMINEWTKIPVRNSTAAAEINQAYLAETPPSDDRIGTLFDQVTITIETLNKSLGKILGDAELTLGGVSDVIQNLSGQLNPILANMETLTGDLNSQISPILTNVETFTDKLSAPSGTAMSILEENGPVISKITEALDSITSIMGNLDKVVDFVPAQLPQIAILLSDLQSALKEAEKMIIAINNNPLLKGGIPEQKETGPGTAAPRDLDFSGP
jgi:phospholipid/cholesterol/gamma-HCH transport system substrate-binding protein